MTGTDRKAWVREAAKLLGRWFSRRSGAYTVEQARKTIRIDDPPDLRMWGLATRRALDEGLIRATDLYAKARSSNGAKRRMYIKGVC